MAILLYPTPKPPNHRMFVRFSYNLTNTMIYKKISKKTHLNLNHIFYISWSNIAIYNLLEICWKQTTINNSKWSYSYYVFHVLYAFCPCIPVFNVYSKDFTNKIDSKQKNVIKTCNTKTYILSYTVLTLYSTIAECYC